MAIVPRSARPAGLPKSGARSVLETGRFRPSMSSLPYVPPKSPEPEAPVKRGPGRPRKKAV